ncbi:MAG: alpha/beta fold hydrolase [Candidatus Cloacimonetes bacterium]|nr:alpha/beta fold hydrolase [Candidatus Cloacimonadota bacterium]
MNIEISYKDYQFIPAKIESSNLVIALHGRGDTYFGMRRIRHKLKLDSMNYLLLNAPDPWTTETGFEGRSWYARPPYHEEGLERSLQIVDQLTSELNSQGITQIYLVGFSQGSVLGLEYIIQYPDKIKGFFGMSGAIFRQEKLLKMAKNNTCNVCLTHGYQDTLLSALEYQKLASPLLKFFEESSIEIWDKGHIMDSKDMNLLKLHIQKVFSLIE